MKHSMLFAAFAFSIFCSHASPFVGVSSSVDLDKVSTLEELKQSGLLAYFIERKTLAEGFFTFTEAYLNQKLLANVSKDAGSENLPERPQIASLVNQYILTKGKFDRAISNILLEIATSRPGRIKKLDKAFRKASGEIIQVGRFRLEMKSLEDSFESLIMMCNSYLESNNRLFIGYESFQRMNDLLDESSPNQDQIKAMINKYLEPGFDSEDRNESGENLANSPEVALAIAGLVLEAYPAVQEHIENKRTRISSLFAQSYWKTPIFKGDIKEE